jgi:hypothetical protein
MNRKLWAVQTYWQTDLDKLQKDIAMFLKEIQRNNDLLSVQVSYQATVEDNGDGRQVTCHYAVITYQYSKRD